MKKFILVLLALSFTFYSGCATIFSGSNSDITFNSEPQGAKLLINGANHGTTPVTVKLKKGVDYAIEFMKEGFENKSMRVSYGLGAHWLILDILSGLIGVIVDASTGNWNEFDMSEYKAVMVPSK
jgi:uncharacterized protein YceK